MPFLKSVNNVIVYPYNPKVDYPRTSFPVGASYPDFNCYWVHSTPQNNPNPELYKAVEIAPVFNEGKWEQVWDYELLPETISVPNWDGLYTALLDSQVYRHLVGLSLQLTPVNSALDKVIAAINYGDKYPDSQVAWDAFQSAVGLLFYALGLVGQSLSAEQLVEVRNALNENGFTNIDLA